MTMESSVAEVFYTVYSEAMQFLEREGFHKESEAEGLLVKLKYTKENIQFVFVFDMRDVVVDHFAVLLSAGDFRRQSGKPLLSLLSETELSNPRIQDLKVEIDKLYKDKKFYRRVWYERDIHATRLLLQRLASFVATVLRRHRDEIIERLHQ